MQYRATEQRGTSTFAWRTWWPRALPRLSASVVNGSLAVVDQGIVSATTFATSVIIGRCCAPGQLGVYYLAFTVVLFVQGLQERGLATPLMVLNARLEQNRRSSYLGSTLVQQTALAAVFVVALATFGTVASIGWASRELGAMAWILAAVAPLLLIREFIRALCVAQLRLGAAVAVDLLVAAVQLGALLALAATDRLSAMTAYPAMGVACGVAVIAWYLAGSQRWTIERKHLADDARRNWLFAKWVIASNLVGDATRYVLPWVLFAFHGEPAVGLLAACLTLTGVANVPVAGLNKFVTAKAAHAFVDGGSGALRRVLGWTCVVLAAALGVILLVFALGGEWIAQLVYGDQFSGAGVAVAVLALAMLITSLGNVAGQGLWAIDRPRANLLPDVTILTVTVLALLCLVPSYGVPGAAAATALGAVAGAGARWLVFARLAGGVGHVKGT